MCPNLGTPHVEVRGMGGSMQIWGSAWMCHGIVIPTGTATTVQTPGLAVHILPSTNSARRSIFGNVRHMIAQELEKSVTLSTIP